MGIINGRYREYKLDNGLVVALQRTPTQTIAGKLRVNYGPSHEMEGEEGMAHFLEHCLVSGGSAKYDPISADNIRASFGYSNAFTSKGRTSFVAGMLSEDFETWIDYVSDHVFNPLFDQDRVNEERERVLRELSDEKSSPMYPVHSEFNAVFYRGHPKGKFILGKEEVVKNANSDKIGHFYSRGYHPNNMDLILAGELPDNVEDIVFEHFGEIQAGKNTRKDFPELIPLSQKMVIHRYASDMVNSENPDESSAQICLSCIATPLTHPDNKDYYNLMTMSYVLGGDSNSLLHQNMSLKKGLAYEVKTSYGGDYNAGELHINATVPAKRIDEAVDTIFEEMERMKTLRVQEETEKRLKRKAKYHFAVTFENNHGHVSAIEGKLDHGLTPESFINGINKVTSDQVLEVANKYLPDKNGKYVLYIRNPLKKD